MTQNHDSLILKPGKDPAPSYRPVSLINVDRMLLTPVIIYPDQSGLLITITFPLELTWFGTLTVLILVLIAPRSKMLNVAKAAQT